MNTLLEQLRLVLNYIGASRLSKSRAGPDEKTNSFEILMDE